MAGRAPKMSRYEAEKALGLTGTYAYKDFQKAYRAAIISTHPDHGGKQEDAIRINEAKACLNFYFGDNKDATFTAADEATAAREQKQAHQAEQQQAANKAAEDFVSQVAQEAYKQNGAEKDAPFTTCEYTSKPQSEWTQEDWDAFKAYQPPMSYKGFEYDVERMKSWSPSASNWAEADNIDVSGWNDNDWYYYWFTNARHNKHDGKVYTRRTTPPLHGPIADKIRAKKDPGYHAKASKFWGGNSDWAETPYGRVNISSFERMGWNGNVGVPWVYAMCEDYDMWLDMNIEAQKVALGANVFNITPVAARHRWRGTKEDIKEARESGFSGWQGTEEEVQAEEEASKPKGRAKAGGTNPISKFILEHLSGCRYALCALVYIYCQWIAVPSMFGGMDNMKNISMKEAGGPMLVFLIIMVITWLAGCAIMKVVASLLDKVLGDLSGKNVA